MANRMTKEKPLARSGRSYAFQDEAIIQGSALPTLESVVEESYSEAARCSTILEILGG
jgi:hypothetical protein